MSALLKNAARLHLRKIESGGSTVMHDYIHAGQAKGSEIHLLHKNFYQGLNKLGGTE